MTVVAEGEATETKERLLPDRHIYFSKETDAKLRALEQRTGLSPSQIIRALIEEASK